MKVFNLTDKTVVFRGRPIPPNGGFVEIPGADSFVPDRDLRLSMAKVLSFGSLPKWWLDERRKQVGDAMQAVREKTSAVAQAPKPSPEPKKTFISVSDAPKVSDSVKTDGWVEKPIMKKSKE